VANSYTPGLKLRKPAQGDDYWDDDLNANFDIIEAALGRGGEISGVIGSALNVTDNGGLTVRYGPGSCRVAGAYKSFGTSGTVNLADNSLSFVYVDSSGAVQASTTLPSSAYCALALVETASGDIVRIGDMRRRLIDFSHQHNDAGEHTNVSLVSIASNATEESAYGRSGQVTAYEDPENSVNNLILKADTNDILNETFVPSGTVKTYTAHALGSGYVPAKANGLILSVRYSGDGTSGGSIQFYPTDGYGSYSLAYVPCPPGLQSFWAQVMFRLGSDGKFKAQFYATPPGATGGCLAKLVGWIEAA
jgi:hypothetical protein